MPRTQRIQYPDAVYHVMSRGNNHDEIVLDDRDRRWFVTLLGDFAERFQIRIYAFCLMNNHYHLFLRTPMANLAPAMQWLGSVYTQKFNWLHERDGHVFKGRYHEVLIEDQAHWLHLSAYIHLNPVRNGLVTDPAEWEWSSFRDYTEHRRFGWLDPDQVLYTYGGTDAERRGNYRRTVLAMAGKPEGFWEELREGIYQKQTAFAEKSKIVPRPITNTLTQKLEPPERAILRFIGELGISMGDLTKSNKNNNRPMVYYFLVNKCGITGKEVARFFGVSESAVSVGIRRYKNGVKA